MTPPEYQQQVISMAERKKLFLEIAKRVGKALLDGEKEAKLN